MKVQDEAKWICQGQSEKGRFFQEENEFTGNFTGKEKPIIVQNDRNCLL